MHSTSQPKRLLLNTIANLFSRFWAKALALLIVPYLIEHLGDEGWGVYCLGGSAAMLISLADPGLTSGYTKVFSEYIAKGRAADLKRLVVAGFVLYGSWSVALLGCVWLLMPYVLALAGLSPDRHPEAAFFFFALFVWRFVAETFNVFYHLLNAAQRMTTASMLTMIGALGHYAAIIVVLLCDGGLVALGWVFMASSLFQGLLLMTTAPGILRHVPQLVRPSPLGHQVRYLLSFAWPLKIAANCETVVLNTDKFFISHWTSEVVSGFYQKGTILTIVLRELLRVCTSALLPVATTLAATGNKEMLREAHRHSALTYARIIAPVFLFLVPAAPFLLLLWLGKAPTTEAVLGMALTAIAFHAGTAFSVSMEFGAASHLPHLQMRSAFLSAGLSLVLDAVLIPFFGCWGAGIAAFIALGASSLYYARVISRILHEPFGPFLWNIYFEPFLAAIIPALGLTWLTWSARHAEWFLTGHRWVALGQLAWMVVLYTAVYAILIFGRKPRGKKKTGYIDITPLSSENTP